MEAELLSELIENDYRNIKEVPGRGICALKRMAFTVGLCYGLDETGYQGRYCFHTWSDADKAFNNWNGLGDPSEDWIKHKGIAGEWSNPNVENNSL